MRTEDDICPRGVVAGAVLLAVLGVGVAFAGVPGEVQDTGRETVPVRAAPVVPQRDGGTSGERTAHIYVGGRASASIDTRRPAFVLPAEGRFTSAFGARWGTTHLGVDIANAVGTPIRSVAAGTVVEAGPATGFGLWVRVRHDDGTVTVYGHVHEILAGAGARVQAGDVIATMGNRGQSTGPHLHFEVWVDGHRKVDPRPWLAERGIGL
ncbi:M23 family metallopeptidase [Actinokineospora sp. 24-640]